MSYFLLFFLLFFSFELYATQCEFLNEKDVICSLSQEAKDGKLLHLVSFGSVSGKNIKFTRSIAFPNTAIIYVFNRGIAMHYYNMDIHKDVLQLYSKNGKFLNEIILPGSLVNISSRGKYIACRVDDYLVMLEENSQQYIEKYKIKAKMLSSSSLSFFSTDEKKFAYMFFDDKGKDIKYIANIIVTSTGKSIKSFIENSKITSVAISSDNKFFAYGTEDGNLFIFNYGDWKKIKSFKFSGLINQILFSKNKKYLAVNNSGDIRIYSTEDFWLLKRKVINASSVYISFNTSSNNILASNHYIEGDTYKNHYEIIDVVY